MRATVHFRTKLFFFQPKDIYLFLVRFTIPTPRADCTLLCCVWVWERESEFYSRFHHFNNFQRHVYHLFSIWKEFFNKFVCNFDCVYHIFVPEKSSRSIGLATEIARREKKQQQQVHNRYLTNRCKYLKFIYRNISWNRLKFQRNVYNMDFIAFESAFQMNLVEMEFLNMCNQNNHNLTKFYYAMLVHSHFLVRLFRQTTITICTSIKKYICRSIKCTSNMMLIRQMRVFCVVIK